MACFQPSSRQQTATRGAASAGRKCRQRQEEERSTNTAQWRARNKLSEDDFVLLIHYITCQIIFMIVCDWMWSIVDSLLQLASCIILYVYCICNLHACIWNCSCKSQWELRLSAGYNYRQLMQIHYHQLINSIQPVTQMQKSKWLSIFKVCG